MRRELTDDQLFERWTARADSAALAELFDSMAPRLLAVAIHLVGDNGQAEDLVQSVFMTLIEKRRQVDSSTPAEAWFVRTLRNRSVDLRRVRRPDPTDQDALEDRASEPDRSIARRELEGQVSQAIDELESPYREVLLARLLHGASAAEIAHLFQRSPGQVRVQLHRGLDMLRARLPEREALAAFLGLSPSLQAVRETVALEAAKAAAGSAALPLSPILLVMSKTKLIAAICLAALLAGYGILSLPKSGPKRAVEAAVEVAEALEPPRSGELETLNGTLSPDQDRRAVEPASGPSSQASTPTLKQETAELTSDAKSDEILLHVVAKTPFGEPLAEMSIRQVSIGAPFPKLPEDPPSQVLERDIGVTGPNGELLVSVSRIDSRLVVRAPEISNLVEGFLSSSSKDRAEAVIVAGATRPLDGVVTDQDENPIPGATVTLICYEDFSARFGVPVAMRSQHLESVEADENGRFEFPRSVESTHSMVKAESPGFEYKLTDAPDRGGASLTIRLKQARQGESVLRGRVVCSDGSSSVGAYVSCPDGFLTTRVTEESGLFELPFQSEGDVVLAVLPGVLPAKYVHAAGTPWPDEIVLTLGEKALDIRGKVVDEAGKPLKGLHVGVIDGSPFGAVQEPGQDGARMRRLEDMGSSAGTAKTSTDGNGTFHIEGLLARPYRLLAQEPDTLRAVVSEPIQAGQSGVRLVLDRGGPSGPIAGRVTDKAGLPLANVSVSTRRAFDIDGFYNVEANQVSAPVATTDADGRFRLSQSAYEDVSLGCSGGLAYASFSIPLDEVDDPLDVQLTLARNCSFVIEWSEGGLTDGAMGMHLEDADGEQVMLLRSAEGGTIGMYEGSLGGPATPVYHVPEGPYEVVISGQEGELTRFSVVIEGAEQQTILH